MGQDKYVAYVSTYTIGDQREHGITVFDVDMDVIEDLYQKIRDTHGFEFTGCDIIFRGICPECK